MSTKTEWGNITWYLLHSLAEKIKEETFINSKPLIIQLIKGICRNLPCPDCSQHATHLVNTANLDRINNKNELKSFLLEFHNRVNRKLGKPTWNIGQVNEKYKNSQVLNIISSFINIWKSVPYNEKLLMESFHRRKFLSNLLPKLYELKKYLN